MSDFFCIFSVIVFMYCTLLGIASAAMMPWHKEDCPRPTVRIDYIFPSRPLGCWLGKEVK